MLACLQSIAQQTHTVTVSMNSDCLSILGVDHGADELLHIYPNPVVSAEDALLSIEVERSSRLEIVDLRGHQLLNEAYEPGRHTIDVRTFTQGIYIFTLHTPGRKQVAKVIIQ